MSLHIAQITDCHLQAHASTHYKGVDADAHLDQCLTWLQQNAQVDLLVLTGDLRPFWQCNGLSAIAAKAQWLGISMHLVGG